MSREDVDFRTFDGLTLRGWLYPASKRGPALIMTQGVCQILELSASRTLSDYS
jgi:hypothetical protein